KTKKNKTQSVKAFVEEWFSRYHLEDRCELSEEDKANSTEVLQTAAQALGITQEALLARDERAVRRWEEKYPFFCLYNRFNICQMIANNRANPAELLLFALFDGEGFTPAKKYNGKSIYDRAMSTLKEADKYLPGSYHCGAKAVDFQFATTLFFTFPKINIMLSSFFDMVDRVKELFFRAWNEDLSDDEIREYNFLANFLQLRDRYVPRTMYYANLKKLVPIYREEGCLPEEDDFDALIVLKFCRDFTPWACKEFSDYPELAQRYAIIYPEAKAAMFDFGKSVKYFGCSFRWSDEPAPLLFSSEEEEERLEEEEMKSLEEESAQDEDDSLLSESRNEDEFDLDVAELSEAPMSNHPGLLAGARILVPKNEEELAGDGEAAEKLLRLGGSVKEGGVHISKPRWLARATAFGRC
ncbi:MAG: hypothetical protein IJS94_04165, partial [Clostridia bacterium]|nr:hypothetical protein [Clostridia bacterium]